MIGVIGCGNMASAIVKGIAKDFKHEGFLTYTPSFTRADKLASEIGGRAVRELSELEAADKIIIACKPQQFNLLAKNLKGSFDLSAKHFISIMAAVSIKSIQQKLAVTKVTRVMPNTPSLYSEGISLILHSPEVTTEGQLDCLKYFSACSKVHLLKDEALFDKVTTVSGSGPAYVFYFAQSFAQALQTWGVAEQEARDLVIQLFKGSSRLMEASQDIPLSTLIDQVTSKGGVTIEALKVFKAKEFDQLAAAALQAAYLRTQELTQEFN
jgi:pyrroline-5-carboxylate reductase